MNGTLTWNANGSLGALSITDQINPPNAQSCSFTHDDLGRVASVNCGPVWSQTFSYDAFGNISKSGTSSFQPTYSSTTNRMTSLPGFTPTYDANGNLLNDSLHIYTWDAEARPVTVDSVGLAYDALGRMVEQNRSGVYSQIVYAPTGDKLALMSGQSLQKAFVSLVAGAQAVYTSSGLSYYRHPDWLGSSRLASTAGQSVYYEGAYAPFGESYAELGSTTRSFTGQNQDTVVGLYDFMFREYSPVQGRWVSPDPLGLGAASASDPQSWNRYAYVGNTPLTATDPLGLFGPKEDAVSGVHHGSYQNYYDPFGFSGHYEDQIIRWDLVYLTVDNQRIAEEVPVWGSVWVPFRGNMQQTLFNYYTASNRILRVNQQKEAARAPTDQDRIQTLGKAGVTAAQAVHPCTIALWYGASAAPYALGTAAVNAPAILVTATEVLQTPGVAADFLSGLTTGSAYAPGSAYAAGSLTGLAWDHRSQIADAAGHVCQ